MAFEQLTDDQLAEVNAGTRNRGVYGRELKEVEGSVWVSLTDGAFAGKDANTVKQGFNNAISKSKDHEGYRVVIVKADGQADRVAILAPQS